MTAGSYLVGLALSGLALVPVGAGALAVRRRLLPDWSGAPARVAEAVVFLALVWAVAQLLGVVGLLERLPLVIGLALAGMGARWAAGRVPAPAAGEPPPAPEPALLGAVAAAAAAALVLAQWGVQVVEVLGQGMSSSDTLSYHGPVAARFFQEGSITSLEFVYSDPIIPFLPFNSELLHAVGMLLLGRDVASPFLNLGWLGLALLSAWCVGRPYGLGPASLMATCLFLASPALVTSQAGSAGNDIVAGALMLAAAALLLNGRWRPQAVGLAGVAAGLALAAKVTAIAPVAVLTIGIVLAAPRVTRWRLGVIWTAAVVVAGGLWYLRNLIRVGNPFPAVGIDIGPISLPSPPLPETFTVSSYLTDGSIWREFYLPGLNTAFGEAWWALLALVAAGIVVALVAGRPLERALAAAALAAVPAYLVTPRSADGPRDVPFFFQFTLRYMTPGLLIALALLPVVRPLAWVARQWWYYAALGVLLLVVLDDPASARGTCGGRRSPSPAPGWPRWCWSDRGCCRAQRSARAWRRCWPWGWAPATSCSATTSTSATATTRSRSPSTSPTPASPWSGSCAPTRCSATSSRTAWSRWRAAARTGPSCRSAAAADGARRWPPGTTGTSSRARRCCRTRPRA